MISATLQNLIAQARQHTEMLHSVEQAECWQAQLETLSAAEELAELNAATMACYRCSNARWLLGWDDPSGAIVLSLGGCAGGVTLPLNGADAGHQLPGGDPFFCSQESQSPAPAGAGGRPAPVGASGGDGDEWESWQKRSGEKS